MRMDRTQTSLRRMDEVLHDDFVLGDPATRIQLVWPLTKELASLSINKKYDVERRLQRHITRTIRSHASSLLPLPA